jgi:hypothetical protein
MTLAMDRLHLQGCATRRGLRRDRGDKDARHGGPPPVPAQIAYFPCKARVSKKNDELRHGLQMNRLVDLLALLLRSRWSFFGALGKPPCAQLSKLHKVASISCVHHDSIGLFRIA